jgi:hypothetical protein
LLRAVRDPHRCAGPYGPTQNLNNTPKTPMTYGARVGWRKLLRKKFLRYYRILLLLFIWWTTRGLGTIRRRTQRSPTGLGTLRRRARRNPTRLGTRTGFIRRTTRGLGALRRAKRNAIGLGSLRRRARRNPSGLANRTGFIRWTTRGLGAHRRRAGRNAIGLGSLRRRARRNPTRLGEGIGFMKGCSGSRSFVNDFSVVVCQIFHLEQCVPNLKLCQVLVNLKSFVGTMVMCKCWVDRKQWRSHASSSIRIAFGKECTLEDLRRTTLDSLQHFTLWRRGWRQTQWLSI